MNNGTMYCIPANNNSLKKTLDATKGQVVKQLELICPTDVSFKRAVKNMHDIFDELYTKLASE